MAADVVGNKGHLEDLHDRYLKGRSMTLEQPAEI